MKPKNLSEQETKDWIRIDQWLAEAGLALSRTHALALIEAGQVEQFHPVQNHWIPVKKGSLKVSLNQTKDHIRVLAGPANRYVSRGGLKLEGALDELALNLSGLRVLDIGVSTGGFSDCCLQRGAQRVVGIDVGHGQISDQMVNHPRFQHFEGINAKDLSDLPADHPAWSTLQEPFDLIVGDLSFISITSILKDLPSLLHRTGKILFLVKPQFELDSKALSKKGLVKDPRSYEGVKNKIIASCEDAGLTPVRYFNSPIEGKDGNREFFLFAIVKGVDSEVIF